MRGFLSMMIFPRFLSISFASVQFIKKSKPFMVVQNFSVCECKFQLRSAVHGEILCLLLKHFLKSILRYPFKGVFPVKTKEMTEIRCDHYWQQNETMLISCYKTSQKNRRQSAVYSWLLLQTAWRLAVFQNAFEKCLRVLNFVFIKKLNFSWTSPYFGV